MKNKKTKYIFKYIAECVILLDNNYLNNFVFLS